jgi:adenosylcobinamide-phosphate synthase
MPVVIPLTALIIEAALGYPDWLSRTIGHPVMWVGRFIAVCDRLSNRADWSFAARRAAGGAAVLILVFAAGGAGVLIERGLSGLPFGWIAAALVASTLIAQRSLHDHVARVAFALDQGGVVAGRQAVAHIVGRDPAALDCAGVARAAIESLAENFSDAVVAPVLWLLIGGLPGGVIYKTVNTADSMIGHRTARHQAFGFAAAKLDDLINLPASRLSAILIIAAAASTGVSWRQAWQAVRRDAHRHRSPNAGYPEAAMAGALGLALAGPRVYGGVRIEDASMGDGRREATTADIRSALKLYRRADAILIAVMASVFIILISIG